MYELDELIPRLIDDLNQTKRYSPDAYCLGWLLARLQSLNLLSKPAYTELLTALKEHDLVTANNDVLSAFGSGR